MRAGVLFAKFANDAHLHVPQDAAHDAAAAAAAPRAPAAHHALRHQVLVSDTKRVPDTTTASQRRRQRATRLSALPADVQLLLLAEKALPRQARSDRRALRLRILPAAVPDQEQPDHAQESAAQGHDVRAQAFAENRRRRRRRRRHRHRQPVRAVSFV